MGKRRKRGKRLLPARDRHLVSRFSYGITPGLAREVRRAGGGRSWFERQLDLASVQDPDADELRSWWPGLAHSGIETWRRHAEEVEFGWQVMQDNARWALLRRIRSRRQVLELMGEFWENHFNVPANGDASFVYRTAYGETIRSLALSSFEQLLQAATTHPAMLIYLDNAVSTARHPNENLGRELLELHTVGRIYDEEDVKDSARILTGWAVDMWRSWDTSYRPDKHWVGRVRVLDFTDANAAEDGRPVTARYLSYLAHHPATARRIAHKLAVKFVRDDPPAQLVEDLARVYLREGTAIKPVLRALVEHPAFLASAGLKVREPGEDVVATYRALRVRIQRPTREDSAANAILWQSASLGASPYSWPRPDGPPLDNASWSTPSRMLASLRIHYALCGGWWPKIDVRYRREKTWVPRYPVRFRKLVKHLCETMLHRPMTPELLAACCAAVDCRPRERITRDHALVRWQMPRLLTCLLDSPDFFSR